MTNALIFLSLCQMNQISAGTELTYDFTTASEEFESLLRFEDIDYAKIAIRGKEIEGKSFEIRIKRFDKGRETLSAVQIDSAELGSLGKVTSEGLSFKMFSKVQDGTAKFSFQFPRFTAKNTATASKSKFKYAMKNFLGSEDSIRLDLSKENYFMAFLLPTVHADGSASYCEVAQSGVAPEQLGSKFNIPTYFLASIRFK